MEENLNRHQKNEAYFFLLKIVSGHIDFQLAWYDGI